jgi:hypothetical protein
MVGEKGRGTRYRSWQNVWGSNVKINTLTKRRSKLNMTIRKLISKINLEFYQNVSIIVHFGGLFKS